jgi:hypothetical protein
VTLQYDASGRHTQNLSGTSFLYDGSNAAQELSDNTSNERCSWNLTTRTHGRSSVQTSQSVKNLRKQLSVIVRAAPSADLIVNSRVRFAERANKRLATLAQAISRIEATAPSISRHLASRSMAGI